MHARLHNLCSPDAAVLKTFKELCNLLKSHYTPPVIAFRERKSFHTAVQNENGTVAKWNARVKKLALSCKFGDNLNAFVLDRFTMGINNKIFERLCEEDEKILLDEALREALIIETKLCSKEDDSHNMQVGNVKGGKYRNKNYNNQNKPIKPNNYEGRYGKNQPNNQKKGNNACSHCGWRNHNSNECRFKQSKCNFCGKIGHLASICRHKEKKSVNYVFESDIDSKDFTGYNSNDFSIYSINNNTSYGNSTELYKVSIKIDGISIDMVCDSGAPCSLVSKNFLNKLNKKVSLTPCKDLYVDYNGNKIEVLGEYIENIEVNGINKKVRLVTNNNNSPLFGRNFFKKL